jgi:diaminopimelate decarboxylase
MTMVMTPKNIRTQIAGVDIAEIVQKFGTPSYVYDAALIRQRISQLKQFDVIRYAQKANSNLAILNLMRQEGVVLDAVSAGELLRAQAAGYSWQGQPAPVVFTADLFDRDAWDLVTQYPIAVNCGSPDMISQLGAVCPGREITLRVNPGFGHGHSHKTNTGGPQSKHGIWHEQLPECLSLARRYGLRVTGLHIHIGSGTDFEHLSQVCQAMKQLALTVGDSLTTISAGGGLPTPYRDSDRPIDLQKYFQLWNTTRNDLAASLGHPLQLEIEPGRFPVAESGYLVTEIRAIKQMGDNWFYLVDAGFNNLARPILYGSYHPMSIASRDGRELTDQRAVIVGGPLCESGDIFTQADGGTVTHRELPVAQVGDWLVIECAGAYGFTMSSNYNSKPLAAEGLIDQRKLHLIRSRQSLRSLFADESIPAS